MTSQFLRAICYHPHTLLMPVIGMSKATCFALSLVFIQKRSFLSHTRPVLIAVQGAHQICIDRPQQAMPFVPQHLLCHSRAYWQFNKESDVIYLYPNTAGLCCEFIPEQQTDFCVCCAWETQINDPVSRFHSGLHCHVLLNQFIHKGTNLHIKALKNDQVRGN